LLASYLYSRFSGSLEDLSDGQHDDLNEGYEACDEDAGKTYPDAAGLAVN